MERNRETPQNAVSDVINKDEYVDSTNELISERSTESLLEDTGALDPEAVLRMNLNNIILNAAKYLKPKENITVSEFAEKYCRIVDGPATGKQTIFPFAREMMDCVLEPGVRTIVYKTSAQIAKTTMMNNIVAYYIAVDPYNMMVAQATKSGLDDWWNDKLLPMLNASPRLKDELVPPRSREGRNNSNITDLRSGSKIYKVSMGSLNQLRGRTVRIIIADEVSGLQVSATEGDPISVLRNRCKTFGDQQRFIMSSTPTFEGDIIEQEFMNGDQRHFYVPCVHCGATQTLSWENNIHLSYIKDKRGKKHFNVDECHLKCMHCDMPLSEKDRTEMVKAGEWIKHNPNQVTIASFYINQLYSPMVEIKDTVERYIEDYQKGDLKSFYNTCMGMNWKQIKESVDPDKLEELIEAFDLDNIPEEVIAITGGVDTQDDRLEIQTIGWTATNHAYILAQEVINGNTQERNSRVFSELDEKLNRVFYHSNGKPMRYQAVCVDSGGHATSIIYDYCQTRNHKNIWAIKGMGIDKQTDFLPFKKKRTWRMKEFMPIGVSSGKEILFNMIKGAPPMVHLSDKLPDDFIRQLTSEEKQTKYIKGRKVSTWNKIYTRNEALDCFVYGLAAKMTAERAWDIQKLQNTYHGIISDRPITNYVVDITDLQINDMTIDSGSGSDSTEYKQNQAHHGVINSPKQKLKRRRGSWMQR